MRILSFLEEVDRNVYCRLVFYEFIFFVIWSFIVVINYFIIIYEVFILFSEINVNFNLKYFL